jgi:tetratricopeptide (TPR) repeat protein
MELGQWEKAEKMVLSTVGNLDATQSHDVWKALTLGLLGKIYLETKRTVKAKSPILLSLQSPHLEFNRAIHIQILLYSAEFDIAVHQYDRAELTLQTASRLAEEGNLYGLGIRATSLLANIMLVQGKIDQAYHLNQRSLEALERLGGDLPGIQPQWIYYLQALILHHGHQPHEAQGHLAKAKGLVLDHANLIRDPELRESYLKNISMHQELMA